MSPQAGHLTHTDPRRGFFLGGRFVQTRRGERCYSYFISVHRCRWSSGRREGIFLIRVAVSVFAFAALMSIAGAQPAVAQWCGVNAQCATDMVCQPSWIPFVKECRRKPCNANSECPNDRPSCSLGFCRAPAGGGSTTGGIPLSGIGQACGQVRIGNVTKHVGCKRHLQCVQGRCQRPPS